MVLLLVALGAVLVVDAHRVRGQVAHLPRLAHLFEGTLEACLHFGLKGFFCERLFFPCSVTENPFSWKVNSVHLGYQKLSALLSFHKRESTVRAEISRTQDFNYPTHHDGDHGSIHKAFFADEYLRHS